MATSMTLALLREAVRHNLQIQTNLDAGMAGAQPGDLPGTQTDPPNTVLNAYINRGIDTVNRICRVGQIVTQMVNVNAADPSRRRKFYVDISGVITNPIAATEIEDVWFTESGTGNTYALEKFDYYKDVQKYKGFPQEAPGRPTRFVVTGPQIALVPPPNVAGVLSFDEAQGIPQLANDSDPIVYLPVEYQVAVEMWATLLCCARNGSDVESQSRMQGFAPMAMQLLQQIYEWKNGYDADGIKAIRDTLMMIPGMTQAALPAPPQQGQGQ